MMTLFISALIFGCADEESSPEPPEPATGIYGLMGEIRPNATEAERDIFAQGETVAKKRFSRKKVSAHSSQSVSCGACHEKPTFGGGGGRYRDFFIYGQTTMDGGFISGGQRGGILSAYASKELGYRGTVEEPANTFALRNPIPFFGIGLLAELPEESILQYADPDDADGGRSGRPIMTEDLWVVSGVNPDRQYRRFRSRTYFQSLGTDQ